MKSCFPSLIISLEMHWQLRYDQEILSHSRLSPEHFKPKFHFSFLLNNLASYIRCVPLRLNPELIFFFGSAAVAEALLCFPQFAGQQSQRHKEMWNVTCFTLKRSLSTIQGLQLRFLHQLGYRQKSYCTWFHSRRGEILINCMLFSSIVLNIHPWLFRQSRCYLGMKKSKCGFS